MLFRAILALSLAIATPLKMITINLRLRASHSTHLNRNDFTDMPKPLIVHPGSELHIRIGDQSRISHVFRSVFPVYI